MAGRETPWSTTVFHVVLDAVLYLRSLIATKVREIVRDRRGYAEKLRKRRATLRGKNFPQDSSSSKAEGGEKEDTTPQKRVDRWRKTEKGGRHPGKAATWVSRGRRGRHDDAQRLAPATEGRKIDGWAESKNFPALQSGWDFH